VDGAVNFRRPSIPTAIALLALFVALDGPAHAQRLINGKLLRTGTVTSRALKDRTVKTRDLSRETYRDLKAVRNGAVTASKLTAGAVTASKLTAGAVTSSKIAAGAVGASAIADRSVGTAELALGSVGAAQIAPNAVGAAQIAPNAVGGAAVADGSLGARDIARFYGRFTMSVPPVLGGTCWSGAPAGLAAERARADISRDLVLVTPDSRWPDDQLSFTVQNDGNVSRFVLQACNPGLLPAAGFEAGFRYMVIDLP
jgi:hypothetical protein